MKRLICPDCGKKGITLRGGEVVASEEYYGCRYCEFTTFVGGMDSVDLINRGRLANVNPDRGLPDWYLTDAGMARDQRAPGTVFLTQDGTVYRLMRSGLDAMTDRYHESFSILNVNGSQSVAYVLPQDATCIWEPHS